VLENTNQQLEALFNNAAIGIITVDERGTIILANQFALRQFGYTSEELKGVKIESLIPRRYRDRHEAYRAKYHAQAHSRPMGSGLDLYAIRKDGTEFPVEVSLSSYTTEEGKFAIAFISDVSMRKASENALVALNAQLEEKVNQRTVSLQEALEKEKELNELKSRFVSIASHEFRTPLSTILSSAFLASKYTTSEEQQKRDKHIDRIVSSVSILTNILNDFLSVGKIEEGKIQVRYIEMDVPFETEKVVSEMRTLLAKNQQLNYDHKGKTKVHIDTTLYRHILMNLISNAIKFSPMDAAIDVNTKADIQSFSLSVKDKGIGISDEDKKHLFERFFRGSNVLNIQGTGLGLHIVSKYTELMNGTIECISEIDKGTEFIITFKAIPD
jgi:PAS domain S-box-containing protein